MTKIDEVRALVGKRRKAVEATSAELERAHGAIAKAADADNRDTEKRSAFRSHRAQGEHQKAFEAEQKARYELEIAEGELRQLEEGRHGSSTKLDFARAQALRLRREIEALESELGAQRRTFRLAQVSEIARVGTPPGVRESDEKAKARARIAEIEPTIEDARVELEYFEALENRLGSREAKKEREQLLAPLRECWAKLQAAGAKVEKSTKKLSEDLDSLAAARSELGALGDVSVLGRDKLVVAHWVERTLLADWSREPFNAAVKEGGLLSGFTPLGSLETATIDRYEERIAAEVRDEVAAEPVDGDENNG